MLVVVPSAASAPPSARESSEPRTERRVRSPGRSPGGRPRVARAARGAPLLGVSAAPGERSSGSRGGWGLAGRACPPGTGAGNPRRGLCLLQARARAAARPPLPSSLKSPSSGFASSRGVGPGGGPAPRLHAPVAPPTEAPQGRAGPPKASQSVRGGRRWLFQVRILWRVPSRAWDLVVKPPPVLLHLMRCVVMWPSIPSSRDLLEAVTESFLVLQI